MEFTEFFRHFGTLIAVSFQNLDSAWGILPVYGSLILGELYKSKVSFHHAVGNGLTMFWAGGSWALHLSHAPMADHRALRWVVAGGFIVFGLYTTVLGFRHKNKSVVEILGHTRFACYFIIMLYPLQTHLLPWSWVSVIVILVLAVPVWVLVYLCGRVGAQFVK